MSSDDRLLSDVEEVYLRVCQMLTPHIEAGIEDKYTPEKLEHIKMLMCQAYNQGRMDTIREQLDRRM